MRQAQQSPEYLLIPGELLVSTDGTVGRLQVVTESMRGWFGSNNLARIRSNKLNIGYLYAFLATPYGQHQICQEIYGGVIDHISEKQIGDVYIPVAATELQKKIGDLVFDAFNLKDKANVLENDAIDRMEKIIEGP